MLFMFRPSVFDQINVSEKVEGNLEEKEKK